MGRNLDDLLLFTRVVDVGSFTAAGRSLGLPTSTVSRRVARLEDRLGVQLLQRTTRKLNLTDAGRTYYDCGLRVSNDLEEAERAIAELQATPRGRLRATAPLELGPVTALVLDFLRAFPEVEVELELTNRHVDLVEEGFDVAVRAGNLPDSSLIAHKLADNELGLFASEAYVERRGAPRTPEEIREHDCIVFPPLAPNSTWSLRSNGKIVRVPLRGRLTVNHLIAAKDAAMGGLGIALIPTQFCVVELAAGQLQQLLPKACPPAGSIWLMVPSRRHLPARVRAFVDFLKNNYAAHLAS